MASTIDDRPGAGPLPDGFVELPPAVYADEPMWIPEDPEATIAAFGPENPWFASGTAHTFCIPGKTRLAAFVGPSVRLDGAPIAFFGYWETVGDLAADTAIFGAAEAWARARGARGIYGPVPFSTFGNYRLRLSAEPGAVTFPGEPFNPPIYPVILERLGFSRKQCALTQLAPASLGSVVWKARRRAVDKVRALGYRIEPLSHEAWLCRLPELHGLVDAMFARNFAYASLSYPAFAAMCGEAFIRKTDPDTSAVCYTEDGAIAGFFLVYPHWGPLVVQGAGAARLATGRLSFDEHYGLLRQAGPVSAVSKTIAVAPEHRRRGINTALIVSTFAYGEGRYDRWYGALIAEGNYNQRYGEGLAKKARRYAVYGKDLSHA